MQPASPGIPKPFFSLRKFTLAEAKRILLIDQDSIEIYYSPEVSLLAWILLELRSQPPDCTQITKSELLRLLLELGRIGYGESNIPPTVQNSHFHRGRCCELPVSTDTILWLKQHSPNHHHGHWKLSNLNSFIDLILTIGYNKYQAEKSLAGYET